MNRDNVCARACVCTDISVCFARHFPHFRRVLLLVFVNVSSSVPDISLTQKLSNELFQLDEIGDFNLYIRQERTFCCLVFSLTSKTRVIPRFFCIYPQTYFANPQSRDITCTRVHIIYVKLHSSRALNWHYRITSFKKSSSSALSLVFAREELTQAEQKTETHSNMLIYFVVRVLICNLRCAICRSEISRFFFVSLSRAIVALREKKYGKNTKISRENLRMPLLRNFCNIQRCWSPYRADYLFTGYQETALNNHTIYETTRCVFSQNSNK